MPKTNPPPQRKPNRQFHTLVKRAQDTKEWIELELKAYHFNRTPRDSRFFCLLQCYRKLVGVPHKLDPDDY